MPAGGGGGAGGSPVTVEFEDTWVEIRRFDERVEAEQHALVLLAMGIDCLLVARSRGTALLVAASDAADAHYQLAAYVRENQRPRRAPAPSRPIGEGIDAALVFCAAVVFVQAAAGRDAFGADWLAAGSAQAGLIANGEWWRTITALGLHGDLGHLMSNLAAGSLFGILIAQMIGPGLTWFAIVAAGGTANALNAMLNTPSHTSIGASTAVFAALGILAALSFKRQEAFGGPGLRRWLPLAAGAMLLAFLGVGGERTDVGAHFAGFAVGCLFGIGLHLAQARLPQGRAAEFRYGAAALGLFAGAWTIALI